MEEINNIPIDNDYWVRWGKLYYWIDRAFKDNQILVSFKIQNDAIKQGEASIKDYAGLLNHIARLAIEDFALCLCKVNYDKDSKNKLSCLNAYLQEHHAEYAIPTNAFQELKNDTSFVDRLKALRDKMLAHNDFDETGAIIQLDELQKALGEVTEVFNELCHKEIDGRVSPYYYATQARTQIDFAIQMQRLLSSK